MSLLNKIGLEKLSEYNRLLDMFNMQHAHVMKLESDLVNLKKKMKKMSDTPALAEELDYMNERYEKLQKASKSNA